MRHVIYLLVVVNLVFFSWNVLQNVPERNGVAHVRRLPPSVRRLETIPVGVAAKVSFSAGNPTVNHVDNPPSAKPSEVSAATPPEKDITRVEALTASEPPGAVVPSLRCHVFGPFPDAPAMTRVETRLNELGYKPRERTSEIRVEAGYWAYLPGMEREKATRITKMLKENNDSDYLILKGNVISLGVYNGRSQADTRVKMLQKYGLDPVVEPHYTNRTMHWLDIDLRDGDDERNVLKTIQAEYPTAQAQNAPCQSIAAGEAID
jgi:hypothetical protein